MLGESALLCSHGTSKEFWGANAHPAMPLKRGPGTVRSNVSELMQPAQSTARKRAIHTIAKRNNISLKDAQFKQAVAIAKTQSRKRS